MLIEEGASAKSEEQDRLKALFASIMNLEKARGGKPDVAIDEVPPQKMQERQEEVKDQMQSRKSTKALVRTAIAALVKVVIKLEGLQKKEVNLAQLLLLRQQEIADAKNDAAEKAREVEMLQAKRLAEVDCDGSVSHGSSASFAAAVSSWTGGVVPRGRSNQVRRVVYQHRFRGQGIRGPSFGGSQLCVCSHSNRKRILSRRHRSRRHQRDPTSVLPKLCSPRSGAAPCVSAFQTSKSQEWPGAGQTSKAAARPLVEGEL